MMVITESGIFETVYYKDELYIRMIHPNYQTISWHIVEDDTMIRIDDYTKLEADYSKYTNTLGTEHLTPLSSIGLRGSVKLTAI